MSIQLKDDIKIFIIGMMGSGKTSIGINLSQRLGFSFIDTDKLIGVDSYFDNHSMDEFRLEEINQIDKIVKRHGSYIISIGGGAILSNQNRKTINQHTSFFLKASINTLINRISSQNLNRPLVKFVKDGGIDKKSFIQLYSERESYYLDLANFIIDTDNLDVSEITASIHNKMINHEIIN